MKTKIWLALLALYTVWGSTYLAIRFTVETIPPFLSAGMRFLISGAILFIWRYAAGDTLPTMRQWRSTAVVGIFLLLGGNGLVSFAEQYVPSGIAALIIGSMPLWMVTIEALRPSGVKPNWLTILGLLIGFGGIFLLVSPSELTGDGHTLDSLGVGALLVAAFLWSVGSIYSRGADMPRSSLMSTGAQMLAGSMALFAVSGLTGEWTGFRFANVSLNSWLGLFYLIAIGSLIGFVSYGWLLQNAPVSLVATYAYVNPLVAVFLGAWLADETINARILVAGLVIIGSVVLINQTKSRLRSAKRKQAQATAVKQDTNLRDSVDLLEAD
ncbi:MAG: EamA family transporter [Anaerolineales bacterium]|nr:EamA family transporter [Anaerolineales bacterium]